MPIVTTTLDGISTIRPVRLLTNLTGSSIALELQPGKIVQVAPDGNLLYDAVVNQHPSLPSYNLDIISHLIESGVLSDGLSTLQPLEPKLDYSSGGTFTAYVTPNKNVKVGKKDYNQATNHLEILPVLDASNNLLAIFYKDIEGISYSTDGGNSSVLINNENLKYPSEITSFAVQIYDSVTTLNPILKVFVGTLREGLKSFTPGKDKTYVNESEFDYLYKETNGVVDETDPVSVIDDVTNKIDRVAPTYRTDYVFQHSQQNIVPDILPNTYKYLGRYNETYSHVATGFAPVYVLGILNFTLNNGCPIIVYTRCLKDRKANFKFLIKNLHTHVYNSNYDLVTVESLWPKTTYDIKTTSGWIVLQTNDKVNYNLGFGNLPTNIVDIVSRYEESRNANTLPSSYLIGIRRHAPDYSSGSAYVTQILKFTAKDAKTLSLSIISLDVKLRSLMYITGLSSFVNPHTNVEHIFITTDTEVWQYSKNVWSKLIYQSNNFQNSSDALVTTAVTKTNKFSTSATDTYYYLSELRGFGLAKVPGSDTNYLGFLASNLGVVQYQFCADSSGLYIRDSYQEPSKIFRHDIYNSWLTAFTIPSTTGMLLGSSLQISAPIRYNETIKATYLTYSPIPQEGYVDWFERKNYQLTGYEDITKFYTSNTFTEVNRHLPDQYLGKDATTSPTLLLKSGISDYITFLGETSIFSDFVYDIKLYAYLIASFGKYIHISISHKISKTVNAGNYTYLLTSEKVYYTPVKASYAAELLSYVRPGYVVDGYISDI